MTDVQINRLVQFTENMYQQALVDNWVEVQEIDDRRRELLDRYLQHGELNVSKNCMQRIDRLNQLILDLARSHCNRMQEELNTARRAVSACTAYRKTER